MQPSIEIRTEYDDNKRLRNDTNAGDIDTTSYGATVKGNLDVGVRSDRYDVLLESEVKINRYISEFNLDSDDYSFNLDSSFSATESFLLRLVGGYRQNSTVTSEFEANGTGVVDEDTDKINWFFSPSLIYSLSDTQSLQANFTHNDTSYKRSGNNVTEQFSDFTVDSVSMTFRQQWTDLFVSTLSLSASVFKVPKIGSGFFESNRETNERSINIGINYQVTPTWSAGFSIGQRFTTTETTQLFNFQTLTFDDVTTSDDSQGLLFSVDINKQFERGGLDLGLSRSTSSQGQGRQQVLDKFSLDYSYGYSPYLKFSLGAGVSIITSSGSEDDGNGRKLYRVSPSIQWKFDRQASLSVQYRFRRQERESDDSTAFSNAISLSLDYQWDKRATQKF